MSSKTKCPSEFCENPDTCIGGELAATQYVADRAIAQRISLTKRIKRLTITAIAGIIIGIIGIAGFIYGATQGNAAYNSGWTHGIEYATEQANYVADTLCGQNEYELYSDLTWYCLADKEAE
jgi:hypothetical protein